MTKPPSFEQTRTCKLCYKTKPEDDFSRKRNGYDTRCKSCKCQNRRERYQAQRSVTSRPKHQIIRVVEVVAKDCPDVEDRLRALESILMDMALDVLMESA